MDNCWLLLVFLGMFLFLQMVTTEPKDNQVYIISRLCDTTVSIDSSRESGRWRRLLFAEHETCQRSYICQVKFRANQAEVCMDFARLRLYGNKTTMKFTQDDNFLQRLTSQRYPKVERYMESKVCAAPGSDLVLKIQADCSESLDRAIIGWFYAYTQSSSKSALYFVDGACKHRHRLAEGAQVTVRSQLWADTGWEVPKQYSSLRLSLPQDLDYHAICVSLTSRAGSTVPAGVQVNVRKVYYNMDNTSKSYLSLKAGDAIHAGDFRCYGLKNTQELLIEVIRDTEVPHWYIVRDGETLFFLKAGIGFELTTENNGDEENKDTEVRNDPSRTTSSFIYLQIIMGGAVVAALGFGLWCFASKLQRNASEARDAEGTTNQPQPVREERADSYISVNSPEASPMLPVLTPTAPGWEQEGASDGGTLSRSGASGLPPSYKDVDEGERAVSDIRPAPPAYSDLFPIRKT